ncbi:MAG: hypothetical protein ACQ9ET_06080, partial [Nitrosomonadaceae bacterium]
QAAKSELFAKGLLSVDQLKKRLEIRTRKYVGEGKSPRPFCKVAIFWYFGRQTKTNFYTVATMGGQFYPTRPASLAALKYASPLLQVTVLCFPSSKLNVKASP